MTDNEVPPLVALAEESYEAIRAFNHRARGPMPAPLVYAILGEMKNVGHQLPQALNTIASGLEASLEAYDVFDGDGRNPKASVAEARTHLTRAAQLAAQLGVELEHAQSAINMQGYRTDPQPGV